MSRFNLASSERDPTSTAVEESLSTRPPRIALAVGLVVCLGLLEIIERLGPIAASHREVTALLEYAGAPESVGDARSDMFREPIRILENNLRRTIPADDLVLNDVEWSTLPENCVMPDEILHDFIQARGPSLRPIADLVNALPPPIRRSVCMPGAVTISHAFQRARRGIDGLEFDDALISIDGESLNEWFVSIKGKAHIDTDTADVADMPQVEISRLFTLTADETPLNYDVTLIDTDDPGPLADARDFGFISGDSTNSEVMRRFVSHTNDLASMKALDARRSLARRLETDDFMRLGFRLPRREGTIFLFAILAAIAVYATLDVLGTRSPRTRHRAAAFFFDSIGFVIIPATALVLTVMIESTAAEASNTTKIVGAVAILLGTIATIRRARA